MSSIPINTYASSLVDAIESRLCPGEWRPFWRQVGREVKSDRVILAEPKHLLLALAKIQKRRAKAAR